MVMYYRARSSLVPTGATISGTSEASSQTVLPREDASLYVLGSPRPLAGAGVGEMVSLAAGGGSMSPSKGAAGGGQQTAQHQRRLKGNWPGLLQDRAATGA